MSATIDHPFPLVALSTELGNVQTVNARDLHTFLGVRRDFPTWIKDRVEQYGFVQGVDYEVFPETGENSIGGRPTKDYAITLDMAKELSMVERTDRGKQARLYFIDMEKKARNPVDVLAALNDPAAMRGMLLTYTEKVLALQQKVEEMEPAVAALDQIAGRDGSWTVTETAKTLGVGPQQLFQWLRLNAWIYRRPGGVSDLAYQDKIQAGYVVHKCATVTRRDGTEKEVVQVRVTTKGVTRLAKIFANPTPSALPGMSFAAALDAQSRKPRN